MITETYWDGTRLIVREIEPRDFYKPAPTGSPTRLNPQFLHDMVELQRLAMMREPLAGQASEPEPTPSKPKTYGVNTLDRERCIFDPKPMRTGVSHKHWSEK